MIYNGDKLIAVLPANRVDEVLWSHQGLTYGGFITSTDMTTPLMVDVMTATLSRLRKEGLKSLLYKCVPSIYHTIPAEEDRWALFIISAKVFSRDVLSVLKCAATGKKTNAQAERGCTGRETGAQSSTLGTLGRVLGDS